VLVDVAVMLADGGEAIGDINVLRHQDQVLGPVASAPTVWRALDELAPAALRQIEVARAKVRRHVWAQLPKLPASQVADTDLGKVVVLDVDATLVTSHIEKEHAAPTFKGGFGYHPLAVWCDNTQEMLAVAMRAGNADSTPPRFAGGTPTVTDHIDVLSRAIAQVPSSYRKHLLIRADGAGSSHGLLDWLTEQGTKRGRTLEYSVGFATNAKVHDAIAKLPRKTWTAAVDADGDVREGGDVAEITALLDLSGWPGGMRLIVRRERPHPGAQLSLFEEADGYRYQVVATNSAVGQLAFLEARHRAHARAEDRIRHAKDSGLGRFPSRDFAINTAWAQLTAISADLIAWLRLLALTPELTKAEPKALRYRLLHVPAKLTNGGRRRRLRIPSNLPWAKTIVSAFAKIAAIQAPG